MVNQFAFKAKILDYLPPGFEPSALDVVCARGKSYKSHLGNLTFSNLIRSSLRAYVTAQRKIDKCIVVEGILEELRKAGSRFVKQEKGSMRWYIVHRDEARTKIGHAIRDLHKSMENQAKYPLHPLNYKSSVKKVKEKKKPGRPPKKVLHQVSNVPLQLPLNVSLPQFSNALAPAHVPGLVPSSHMTDRTAPAEIRTNITSAEDAIIGLLVLGRRVRP